MSTGQLHQRFGVGTYGSGTSQDCRCTIGEDHNEYDILMADMDPDPVEDTSDDEALGVHDAADIWLSNGMDEDYTFGYSIDELRRAAGM